MSHITIVAFATTFDVVFRINAHVHGIIVGGYECGRFKNHHVYCHGAVVTGEAKHADRIWAAGFVI